MEGREREEKDRKRRAVIYKLRTAVSTGDFRSLVGVKPDLALAALEHTGRQAL